MLNNLLNEIKKIKLPYFLRYAAQSLILKYIKVSN